MNQSMSISVDARQAAELATLLKESPKKLAAAARRSVKGAAGKAVTRIIKTINKSLGLSRKDLTTPHRYGAQKGQSKGAAIETIKYKNWLACAVHVTGARVPLIYFNAVDTTVRGMKGHRGATGWGVFYKIGKKGSKQVKDGFIATMDSGHKGVFRRRGKSRVPIIELRGPSIPHVALSDPMILPDIERIINFHLYRKMQIEIDRILMSHVAGGVSA